MRKHSARKWLHFVLDLLPILVLPIFAIYEINHEHNTPIEVEVEQNEIVNFNQLVNNGNFQNSDNWSYVPTDSTLSISDGFADFQPTVVDGRLTQANVFNRSNSIYLIRLYSYADVNTRLYVGNTYMNSTNFNITTSNTFYSYTVNVGSLNLDGALWLFQASNGTASHLYFTDINVFNLTQMFGAGNEPNALTFDTYYTERFYERNIGTNQLLTIGTETLSNTDIGSQMLYSIYKPVKDYFNFNNVFNFGDVYHWFELNMFGGNAPMPFFIVWNIIVYQFLMDLMFLVYSIFMFIIDFTSECLERCFSFSRHGGSR